MEKSLILKEMEAPVAARGCFVVEVTVSRDNDVVLCIESEEGVVAMDDCIAVNEAFLAAFDKEVEDYSLTVTSAGLDRPFKTLKQLRKARGTEVEAAFKGGRKLTGVLEEADEKGITLKYSVLETLEGRRKKEPVLHSTFFPFEGLNAVSPHFAFDKIKQNDK